MNNLHSALENMVGSYADEKTYENLIKINPHLHTKEKLLLKKVSVVPEDDMAKYLKAYQLAKEWVKKYKKEIVIMSVNTIAGIITSFFDLYNIEDINDVETLEFNKINIYLLDTEECSLHECIKFINSSLCNDIFRNRDYRYIISLLNSKLQKNLLYIEEQYDLDDVCNIINNAINDVCKDTEDIFYVTRIDTYIKRLEPYLEKRISKHF
jgi:hypothetical protein